MAATFTRRYLIISMIPIILLLALIVPTGLIIRNHLADLITQSTYDLNQDAENSLRELGEQIIQAKSRDVARQVEMYFRMHPNVDIRDMRKDPLFMKLALTDFQRTKVNAFVGTDSNKAFEYLSPRQMTVFQELSKDRRKAP